MTSSDALRTTSQDGIALEDANIAREAYNIGILYFRSTNATKPNDWESGFISTNPSFLLEMSGNMFARPC